MASVLSPRTPPAPAPPRPAPESRSLAFRISCFTGLSLALALPLIALAAWAHRDGFVSPSVHWVYLRGILATQGPGFSHLGYVYPPLPVLLSLALPGDAFTLAIVTCLFFGAMLAYMLWNAPDWWSRVLLLPLVAVPAMWYTASQLLPQVIALTFLAVALGGFVRFSAYGETYGGFIAGLALAVSYSADPGALLYAAVMCLTVLLSGARRFRAGTERISEDLEAPVGVCAVLVFPCVAMAACWSFLLWKFTGDWPGNLAYAPHAHVLQFPLGVWPGLGHALVATLEDVVRAPLYLVTAVLLTLRRGMWGHGAGLVLPVLALAAALWLGFDYSPVTAYFLLTMLAVTSITEHRMMDVRYRRWILLATVIIQIVVAWVWQPSSPGYDIWRHLLFG